MLVGFRDYAEASISHTLLHSQYKFYLTGSRFFGDVTGKSDWDFFCQIEAGLIPFLVNLGFDLLHVRNANYKDELTLYVYRNKEARIDIQIVEDAELKWRCQNYIIRNPMLMGIYRDLKKIPSRRDTLWNMVFAVVKGITPFYCNGEQFNASEDMFSAFDWQEQVRKFLTNKVSKQPCPI